MCFAANDFFFSTRNLPAPLADRRETLQCDPTLVESCECIGF